MRKFKVHWRIVCSRSRNEINYTQVKKVIQVSLCLQKCVKPNSGYHVSLSHGKD